MRAALALLLCLGSIALCSACFPTTQGWGSGPNAVPRNQWWCSSFSGFLGFSYPVEDDNCNDYSYNGFKNDFTKQKQQYGATFVRLYLPTCRQTSFWVNMVKAARDSNVGLIPMVFWDWGQNDPIMNAAENALLGVFTDPEVGSIAPYIIHSVAFGDELGEQGNYWLGPMQQFKSKLAQYGVLLSISDDWDRDVYQTGSGLTSFGQQVNNLGDLTQAHIQPYYHPWTVAAASDAWGYINNQLNNLVQHNKRPIFVSQTMWSYNQDGHQRGQNDQYDNMQNYQNYWNAINANHATFENLQVGWFFHTWYGEPGFDLIGDNGSPVTNFKPIVSGSPAPAGTPPASGYLQSKSNGNYVTLDSNSILVASATSTSSATRFTFTQNQYGYTIKAAQFVSAENYGWNPLVANRPTADSWESFIFTPVGSAWEITAYINYNLVAVQSNGQLQATQANSGSIPSSAQFAIV